MSAPFIIIPVRSQHDLADAIQLIYAYTAWLDFDLAFQNFDAEIAAMPGKYAPPTGDLLLARNTIGEAIGCVAVRPIQPQGCCEMKRLYVAPAGRGMGVGKALAKAIIDIAERIGYSEMRLDTLPRMAAAVNMYQKLGFEDTEAYYHNPMDGARYLAKSLTPKIHQ